MMKYFLKRMAVLTAICCLTCTAHAELQYYPDPPHQKLAPGEPGPMDEMIDLAKGGDPRAAFILGDLYEKGKGGLAKDWKESRKWFEFSAMHGYTQSFIRLAALAKHEGNSVEAWQWYTLAIDGFSYGDAEDYAINARKELMDTAKLSRDDIKEARKSMSAWKDKRDDTLRAEKEPPKPKEEEKPAAVAEKETKPAAATDDNDEPYQQERNNSE